MRSSAGKIAGRSSNRPERTERHVEDKSKSNGAGRRTLLWRWSWDFSLLTNLDACTLPSACTCWATMQSASISANKNDNNNTRANTHTRALKSNLTQRKFFCAGWMTQNQNPQRCRCCCCWLRSAASVCPVPASCSSRPVASSSRPLRLDPANVVAWSRPLPLPLRFRFCVGFGLGSSGCYDCRCQSR